MSVRSLHNRAQRTVAGQERDQKSDLPPGWSKVRLGDVLLPNGLFDGPFGSNLKTSDYVDSGVRVIRLENLGNIQFHDGKRKFISRAKYESLVKHTVVPGDIIFGSFVDQQVRVCVLPHLDTPAIAKADCFCIRPIEKLVDSQFLTFSLGRDCARDELAAHTHGATRPRINTTQLREHSVSLPPLAEQRRIVAKLELLLRKVSSSQQRLSQIPSLLKRFRQSVLAAACSGKLTADWREEKREVELASALITGARFQLVEDVTALPELPTTWEWVPLGNYARCSRGRFLVRPRNDPSYFGGPYPFIQIGNLPPEGGCITAHTQTLNEKGLRVSKMFLKGTVAIAIVGATIGNTGFLGYDMCFTDSMVGLETGSEAGNRYIEFFLRHCKNDIREASYAGGGQPNIKLDTLNPYPLALPPLAEQQEIVRRVEKLFAFADQIEARMKLAQAHVDRLTQSLLAKAFRGDLVPH